MKREYFWSLILEPGWVSSCIWSIDDDQTQVASFGPGASWESVADLVTSLDESMSAAITQVGSDDIEPSKVVFGVSPSWVEEGQIKKEFLEQIKQVCHKLSLSPAGFVVLPEAVSHFVKSEEGTGLNGIVVGIGANFLDIAVFKLGSLVGMVTVGRSVSVVEDLVEGLTRFGLSDSLPSRILLYNGKDSELEHIKQEIIKADWQEQQSKVKFLHTPAVESIDHQTKLSAVSLAGASEMANVTKIVFPKHSVTPHQDSLPKATGEENEENEIDPHKKQVTDFFQNLAPADVGFMIDKDVQQDPDDNLLPVEKVSPVTSLLSRLPKPHLPKDMFKVKSRPVASPMHHDHSHIMPSHKISFSPKLQSMKLTLLGIIALLILVGSAAAWWFLPKAQVTIYVAARSSERRESVIFSPSATSLDRGGKIVPAKVETKDVSGEKTISTSGSKTVGEKAKGKITIRNGTSVGIKVSAGTILTGPNDLKFSLDSSASVSAALSPSTPGTLEADITAENIGSDHNLAKDETLKIGNYPKSDVDGIVISDLSGGSSRQITAVSASDQKSVQDQLTQELQEEAISELESSASSDEIFIPESIESQIVSRDFSNKVGDEASSLRLSMAIKFSGISVLRSDMGSLAEELLRDQVPSGYVFRPSQVTTSFVSKPTKAGDAWQFETKFSANLLPELDPVAIGKKIVGKSAKRAQEILGEIPGFVRAQIKFSPKLPGQLSTLPHVDENISIEIASEK